MGQSLIVGKVLATASHYWPLDAVDGIHELWDQIGNRPGYRTEHLDYNDPTWCGPEGITFSFFWKNHESESRFAVASGGKVISNGFSVYTNNYGGYVEFYTRGNNHRWKANIRVPGPYWTHILFTWTKKDGLKVYINGTFIAGDTDGSVSENYGDPYPDLVIGTRNDRASGHYVTGAFDEFVIWERALSPQEILLYYSAAMGRTSHSTGNITCHLADAFTKATYNCYISEVAHLWTSMFYVLYVLCKKRTYFTYLGTVCESRVEAIPALCVFSISSTAPLMSLLTSFFCLFLLDFYLWLLFLPLFSVTLPFFLSLRINKAADFKNHKIQVASCLISLKVEPSPALSVNLSGAPLIKIVLTHILVRINPYNVLYLLSFLCDSKEGVWSNEGCVRSDGNMTYSVCLCNHLTNFAILMQVVPLKLTTGHRVALSTIGYVGCSISIICLAITLVTFAVLSSVSTIRNQRYHIHANLSFAILVAEILLLISARFDPGTLPCKVMAVLLHFFFLSAFAWMLVEGLHLYSMVVKVFGSEGSKHFYYYGIGWGSPLVICVVSVTSALNSYGEVDNCWLSLTNGAIWAFVAPALFVIVVNIGILISVTRIISRISGESYKVHGDANAVKLTVKAVAVLLPILGISWIFGVLAVNTHSLPFLYIFAVFNSLQGFFVFLFHCLLNSEVRAAFKHKTKVWSLTSSSIRNINVKPFNSDIMNGNKEGVTPTKMNTWDKSSNSANRIDLSAV
uniref:Adhesion G protein-coupled receptor D1 n=1 Tax=Sander lucioperca TaxID=283035 RepID=A0A8D0CNR4_SANLU